MLILFPADTNSVLCYRVACCVFVMCVICCCRNATVQDKDGGNFCFIQYLLSPDLKSAVNIVHWKRVTRHREDGVYVYTVVI